MGKLLKCHLKGKNLYGQYIDHSEKKWPKGFICPYTGTIFYNIRIYSRSQVSVYRTIGPLVLSESRELGTLHPHPHHTHTPPPPPSPPQQTSWSYLSWARLPERNALNTICFLSISKDTLSRDPLYKYTIVTLVFPTSGFGVEISFRLGLFLIIAY